MRLALALITILQHTVKSMIGIASEGLENDIEEGVLAQMKHRFAEAGLHQSAQIEEERLAHQNDTLI